MVLRSTCNPSAQVLCEEGCVRCLGSVQQAQVEEGKDPAAKRRRLYKESAPSPSVEEIEADFWRIVEEPDQVQPIPTQ
jgi:hypothetical protein